MVSKRKKNLGILLIVIFINFFSIFYLIDSEIGKLCQPSERYNMAESYRPGGEYISYSENQSVTYSGYVRLSGKSCEKIPNITIEFWFKDSNGSYTKETRLKVKTDSNGFFEIKTGGFQKGNLPYHIHYLVSGAGIRPMTGNYNNLNYNSNDNFDIIVLPAESSSTHLEFLGKALSSGDNKIDYEKNASILTKLKSVTNLEKIKYISIILQLIFFIIFFSILAKRRRNIFYYVPITTIIFILLILYNNKNYTNYDPKTKFIPIVVNEKATLTAYKMAEWAPVLNKGIIYPLTEEIEIAKQEDMFSQVFVSNLAIEELEKELREFYLSRGIILSNGAVNMWGADANWQYSYNLSGITIGKEVNITLSNKLGDGRLPPDVYKSVAIIWQIDSKKINKYIVDSFKGYGDGFIDLESLSDI